MELITKSQRQLILEAIEARLRVIRKDNEFQTDAGFNVFVGFAPELGPDDPKESLALLVGDDQPKWQNEHVQITLPIEIQALTVVDLTSAQSVLTAWQRVEAMIGDIKRAMELEDRRLGRLIQKPGLERGKTRTIPLGEGSRTGGTAVAYTMNYAEQWGTP